jgi:hypothetical protein
MKRYNQHMRCEIIGYWPNTGTFVFTAQEAVDFEG